MLTGRRSVQQQRRALDGWAARLGSLDHKAVLKRGFALVRDDQGRLVRQASSLAPGDAIEIEFADGRKDASIQGRATPSKSRPRPKPKSGTPDTGGQGQLF